MGQPQSSEEGSHQDSQEDDNVPYTKYSLTTPSPSSSDRNRDRGSPSTVRGITVVNPKPDQNLRKQQPLELQKLERIHRFWPILKSSVQHSHPVEKVSDGLEYRDLLVMCTRYQSHLQDTAAVVAVDQRALTSRLKDLEMFSTGIAQQMIRRQERMQRILSHLEKVREMTEALNGINSSVEQCVPLLHRLNQLLPETDRLETFHLHPRPSDHDQSEEEEDDEEDEREKGGENDVVVIDKDDAIVSD